jgi:hypothetical protein
MFAMLHGRIDDIARYGEQAWASAVRAGMPDAHRLGMLYRGSVARERSGPEYDAVLESGAAMLREHAARMPGQYFEADVAEFLLYCGRPDEARAELARAMPSLLTTYDYRWHLAAANAAEVAAAVGHVSDCERLYVKLLPHADVFVAMGPAFWGSTRHRLGLLAHRMDRVDDALDHLRRAVDELDAVAALSWAARARVDLARALRAAGQGEAAARAEDDARQAMQTLGMTRPLAALDAAPSSADAVAWSLTRDGTDWLLTAGAEHARFRGGRGFEHLAVLLAHPGQDIAALDLDAGPDTPAVGGGLEVLDDRALAAYRRRLAELDDDLAAADRRGDASGARALTDEREHLLAELRSATGLGGRKRRTNDVSERARVNVTRNLKRAVDQISRAAPIAGVHLSASIRTGLVCRYDPVPGGPERWRV